MRKGVCVVPQSYRQPAGPCVNGLCFCTTMKSAQKSSLKKGMFQCKLAGNNERSNKNLLHICVSCISNKKWHSKTAL